MSNQEKNPILSFEIPREKTSIIKVLGLGGGGGNAVKYMFEQGIKGVDFIVCNTDAQALDRSSIPNKVQLGAELTQGLGAGNKPEVGKAAAEEAVEQIRELLTSSTTKMVFLTAGMGGGTGTGASPVIAQLCQELGILTVAIVTAPFTFEGTRRIEQAREGLAELRKHVDAMVVISNDKIREMYGDLKFSEAFGKADDVLARAARGIAEIITVSGYVNVDFNDVDTVMRKSGVAIMSTGIAEGPDRAAEAVEGALNSPLLNDYEIKGAKNLLVNICSSRESEISMDEMVEVTEYICQAAGFQGDMIWGHSHDEELGGKLSITLIATGFQSKAERPANKAKVVIPLDERTNSVLKPEVANGEDLDLPDESPVRKGKAKLDRTQDKDGALAGPSTYKPLRQTTLWESGNGFSDDPEDLRRKVLNKTEKQAFDERSRELEERKAERAMRLNELSMKLNSPNGLAEMETVPAYKRRNVELDKVPSSDEQEVSRYTLGTDENDRPEIRPNNRFLHDNVD